jgi:hypothetical protein
VGEVDDAEPVAVRVSQDHEVGIVRVAVPADPAGAERYQAIRLRLLLVHPRLDLDWLTDTTTIMAAAETCLLITRLTSWDLDAYQDWLATTCTRLARVAEEIPDRLEMATHSL